ncbi:MAG: DUF885 domain-containing protein, partial [Planctomycetes bacterium]|nr:DUF885 domain-containing protein [Planctomycetota bacterium]
MSPILRAASSAALAILPHATAMADDLHAVLAEAWELQLREYPLFATYAGDARFNDRLDSMAEADVRRRNVFERSFLERLRRIDRSGLPPQDRISHEVLERSLRDSIGELEHGAHLMPITNREGFHVSFARLPEEAPLATVKDHEDYVARLGAFRRYAGEHVALLREGIQRGLTLPRVVLEGYEGTIAPHAAGDPEKSLFHGPFERLPAHFPEADRVRLAAAGRKAIAESVQPGYRDFLDFMTREYIPAARSTLGASALPGGRAFYEHRVRMFTTLEVSPEEVHATGLREVERIRREMEAAIAKMGFRGSFAELLEHLRKDPRFYASTPEALLKEAAYVSKRMDGELPRLFRKLPRTPYGIKPIPGFIAPRTTGAYYSQPSGDGTRSGTYFLNTHDLRSRPLYLLEALSLHEAVPGHHLQLALQQELEGLPPFRRFVEVTVFVEGWALYAERLGLEVGFYQDPYSDFGRLTYE